MYLTHLAQSDKTPTVTSIVSDNMPHLRKGAMRDFLNILKAHNYYEDKLWHATDSIYTFETGSIIEFFGADEDAKVRGPRRDRLFINEANSVEYDVFDQLEIRTKEFTIMDWNPVTEFWFEQKLLGVRDDIDHLILTYLDNEALDPRIKQAIELHKHDEAWWRVYGQGLIGEAGERIYTKWELIDEIPHEARLERRGHDFGYTADPSAAVDVYYWNGGYIFDEILYDFGLTNREIHDRLSLLPRTITVGDSAEQKSIDEINSYSGFRMIPAVKGPGSVLQGIQLVQGQKIWVTKRSVNLLKEYRGYLWRKDRDGNLLNVPIGKDHALDAIRYALASFPPRALYGPREKPKTILDELLAPNRPQNSAATEYN